MVEYQMSKRNANISRQTIFNNINNQITILPYIYPNISALVPTFDCGSFSSSVNVNKNDFTVIFRLLDLLNQLNCHGTFNIVGKTAEEHEDFVKTVFNRGNDIWGHGYSHVFLDRTEDIQQKEVKKTVEVLSSIINSPLEGWRSPYGTFNARLYQILQNNGIKFGSNWGSSTWGSQPFFPIVDGEKLKITELPFDDYHYDSIVFRKLNLPPTDVLKLYKSKLLAHINNMTIFTTLTHPIYLDEDELHEKMIHDFLKYASNQSNLWITSGSRLLSIYRILSNYIFRKFNIEKEGKKTTFNVKIEQSILQKDLNSIYNNNIVTMTIKTRTVKSINCNSDYQIVHLSNYEDAVCLPFDLKRSEMEFTLEIAT